MAQEDDTYVIHGPEPLTPLPGITLGKLIYDHLTSEHDHADAMVDAITGETISYQKILETSIRLLKSLLVEGYDTKTIFSICSENNLQFFIPIISTLFMGSIMAPINHNYTETELVHAMGITKPQVLFCSRQVAPKFIGLKGTTLNYIKKIIIIDSDIEIPGAINMEDFIKKNLLEWPGNIEVVPEEFDPDETVAFVLCSSGTTGLPKGVMVTHTNAMVRYMHTTDPRYIIKQEIPVFFGILPFFHGYGLITNLFALTLGEKIVVLKQFKEDTFLKAIQDYRISTLWLAPPLVLFLAKSPLVDKYDLSSVKEIVSGAAPLNKDTEEAVKARLNINTVRQGYGLTEATLAVIIMSIGEQRFGSSGKIVSYMSCKVRDPDTGKSLPANQVGELCFKGPMVMKGYYGNEEATKSSFTSDGWLLTGDLGYYEEEGYFFIVDRLKELIKYKGYQVAPAELEAIILTHPKVRDVGVVGIPLEDVGELPLAFVVKTPNTKVTGKEIEDFVAGKVSNQKRLRGGIVFVDAIPRNPSGKILRRDLRKMLQRVKSKV